MRITTRGQVCAASFEWSLRGALFLTLVAKTRYRLTDGAVMQRLEPTDVAKSAAADAAIELAPHRLTVDVILRGHAAVGATEVRLAVLPRPPAVSPKPLLDKRGAVTDGLTDFGAMAPGDPRRARLVKAVPSSWPLSVVDDINWTYFNCAPSDQQMARIGGREWLVVEGLRGNATMTCRLSDDMPCVELTGVASTPCALPMRADALIIDGDEMTCELIWRGTFRIPGGCSPHTLRATIQLDDDTATTQLDDQFAGTALLGQEPPLTTLEEWLQQADETATLSSGVAAALPFQPGSLQVPAPGTHSPESSGTVTLSDSFQPDVVLPFDGDAGAAPAVRLALGTPRPPDPLSVPRAASTTGDSAHPIVETRHDPNTSAGIALDNATRFSADVISAERECVAIIAKATCTIVPGAAALIADEQRPLDGERLVEDAWGQQVVAPPDRVPFKPQADIMAVGVAYAPSVDTRDMKVALAVEGKRVSIMRELLVFGARAWQPDIAGYVPSEPEIFTVLPLCWQLAFGGSGVAANPVGMGVPDRLKRGRPWVLPHLEDPQQRLRTPKQRVAPACFAPLPASWKARPSTKLCDDHDWGRHQAAPVAQRCAWLDGDEQFSISGMNANHPILTGKLPGVRLRSFVKWGREPATHAPLFHKGEGFEEVTMALDTVLFEPHRLELVLSWRGVLPVPDARAPQIARIHLLDESLDAPPQPLESIQQRLEG